MADNLIAEVNEALRQERMQRAWERAKWPLFITIALIIAATAGSSIYSHFKQEREEKVSAELISAIQAYNRGLLEEANAGFGAASELAKEGSELSGLAQIWQAKAHMHAGAPEKAAASLLAVIAQPAAETRTRDMACVHLYSLLGTEGVALPTDCTGEEKSPLQTSLKMLHAAHLWQKGDAKKATGILQLLAGDARIDAQARSVAESYLTSVQAAQQ